MIWNAQNGIIFDNKACSLADWKAALKVELGLVCIKAKKSISEPLDLWRERTICNFFSSLSLGFASLVTYTVICLYSFCTY
jgi:hypothetical protein